MRRDSIFYQLFRQSPTLFFELLPEPPANAQGYVFESIDLVSTIIVYKFSNLTRDEVDVMLGIEIQQTRVYRDAEEEGSVRGRQEEAQSLILRMLNRRVGNLSPAVEMRVKALPLVRVEDLGEALLDFGQMSDLMSWLDAHQGDRAL